MKPDSKQRLFTALSWRFTLISVIVLGAILLAIAGFLYLADVIATDAEINRLLNQTAQQELAENPIQALRTPQQTPEVPHPFSPVSLQAYFVLVDPAGNVRKGVEYQIPAIPDQAALEAVLKTAAPDKRELNLSGSHLRLYTLPVKESGPAPTVLGALQVYISLEGRDSELSRLLLVLLVSSGVGIALSSLAARFLASRALIPVRRAFEQQEQFVADASHELRTPLALVQADLELLQRAIKAQKPKQLVIGLAAQPDDEDQADSAVRLGPAEVELIEESQAEIGRMKRLITELLQLAKYDAGRKTNPSQIIWLAPLLQLIEERLAEAVRQADLTLHLCLEDPAQFVVEGDEEALRRLVVILLTNAIQYTAPGGQIWLEVRPGAPKQIEIIVKDTGRGLAPSELPHLFTRFYRTDKARTHHLAPAANDPQTAPDGTGLGLAIARSIVESHGGKISASSSGLSLGSTFTVTLPQATKNL